MSSPGPAPITPQVTRRPLFDPESIPLDPSFNAHEVRGRAVTPERLSPHALRARFATPPTWQPELRTDGRLLAIEGEPRPAAVLIPLIERATGLNVLLTRRAAHLHDHAGQISFPGGRIDAVDSDAIAAALREAHEEIGLASSAVEVMGTLPEYLTATHYRVTPVVGLVPSLPDLRLDAFEVAAAFEVPLAFLMDPANHERRLIEFEGQRRTFYAMPYPVGAGMAQRHFIWGATAAMLRNLYHFLRA